MFSLFDGVWKINPDSIVKQLKKSLLGDYAEDLGQFVTDVKADVVETVTDWGQAFGLVEDKKADLDLLAEQAQEAHKDILSDITDVRLPIDLARLQRYLSPPLPQLPQPHKAFPAAPLRALQFLW